LSLTSSIPFSGQKGNVENPWGSTTLDVDSAFRPGHGKWPGEIPEVHRWPYDYAKDGRDFIPQTEPLGSNESAH